MNLMNFVFWRLKDIWQFSKNLYHCYKKHLPARLALCCDIVVSEIPEGTIFPHPIGIAIRSPTMIGKNVLIRQNVTIGMRHHIEVPNCWIEDNVEIGANALILGNITLGRNSVIGAGPIVLKDGPANQTVIGTWK